MWYGIWDDQAFGLRAVWSLFGIFAPIHLLLSFSALNLPPIHFQLKLLPILSFFWVWNAIILCIDDMKLISYFQVL